MKAVVLNCSLKSGETRSNTQMLADEVIAELHQRGVESTIFRLVDLDVLPGVETDLGDGDGWPPVHDAILDAEILVVATPTWVGRPSSIAQRALERMDAMISETDDDGRPVAYDKVAGVVVTGNEDGAHHVISEVNGALVDIGFTIPPQSWTYWNKGPGPGPEYPDTDEGHDWSISTGRAMAQNLVAVAEALAGKPLPAPPQ
ncbi:MAG: flavodoxin family protein [Marmoricola sp.]|nr:flavodoxin family protein [Marmoricola sp.]